MKQVWRFLAVCGFTSALAVAIHFLLPEQRHWLVDEDDVVENLSVLFFLLGFFLNAYVAIRVSSQRWLPVLCGLISLAGALDELSFGERLLHLNIPRIRGVKVDGLHDTLGLVKGIVYSITHRPRAILFLCAMALCLLIAILPFWTSRLKPLLRRFIAFGWHHARQPYGVVMQICVAMLVMATVIDRHSLFLPGPLTYAFEEIFELNMGIGFCFFALALTPVAASAEACSRGHQHAEDSDHERNIGSAEFQ